jgi:hypothetical protein
VSSYELAQVNIAKMRATLASPLMAEFVFNLGRVNALADDAPGFVWRLKDDSSSAAEINAFGNDYVVNISVWKDVASLSHYAFNSGHADIMRRRREWFEPMTEAHAVLWWIAAGHRPTVAEARQKLDHLRSLGAGPLAFTFKQSYLPPNQQRHGRQGFPNDACPTA